MLCVHQVVNHANLLRIEFMPNPTAHSLENTPLAATPIAIAIAIAVSVVPLSRAVARAQRPRWHRHRSRHTSWCKPAATSRPGR